MRGTAVMLSSKKPLVPETHLTSASQSASRESLRSYDGIAHQGMFAVPKFLREAVAAETRVITREEPLFVV